MYISCFIKLKHNYSNHPLHIDALRSYVIILLTYKVIAKKTTRHYFDWSSSQES